MLFLLGLCLGSFLNVCIYRIPLGISVVSNSSFCPNCSRRLRWRELIPVLSYLLLKGKCRTCSTRIPALYPVIELSTGILLVLLFALLGLSRVSIYYAAYFLMMFPIAVIDWRHLIIPNRLLIVLVVLGLFFQAALFPANPTQSHSDQAFENSISTANGGFLFSIGSSLFALCAMLLLRLCGNLLFHKETLGMGDIKLAAVVGLFLGIQDFLICLWLSALIGSIYGIARARFSQFSASTQFAIPASSARSRDPKSENGRFVRDSVQIPFGSFLAATSSAVLLLQVPVHGLISSCLIFLQ